MIEYLCNANTFELSSETVSHSVLHVIIHPSVLTKKCLITTKSVQNILGANAELSSGPCAQTLSQMTCCCYKTLLPSCNH